MNKCRDDLFDIESMLLEYASGSCTEAREILISSYMSFCEKSCEKVYQFEHMGGVLMNNMCEPVKMKQGSLDNVLGLLEMMEEQEQRAASRRAARQAAHAAAIPEAILHKLRSKGRRLKWTPIYRGIRYCAIPMDCAKETAMLLKISPGAHTPHHEHNGIEITLVLEGAFQDDNARYTAGQIVVSDKHTHHEPVADAEQGCVCLMISDAPIHFTRGLSRLLNLFQRF